MLSDDTLAHLYIISTCGITGCLDRQEPVVVVGGLISPAPCISVTHQQSRVIFYAFFRRQEVAELLIGAVIIVNAIRETAVQPALVGFDAEEVIAHLCQVAVSPFAFESHLSQNNGRWNAIFPLLSHRCFRIVFYELSWRKQVVFLYSEGFNSPGFCLFYIQ